MKKPENRFLASLAFGAIVGFILLVMQEERGPVRPVPPPRLPEMEPVRERVHVGVEDGDVGQHDRRRDSGPRLPAGVAHLGGGHPLRMSRRTCGTAGRRNGKKRISQDQTNHNIRD